LFPLGFRGGGGLGGLIGGIGAGLGAGIGNLVGGIANVGTGLAFGVADGIASGIGNALGGGWGYRDWDDYYRKLAVEGVDTSNYPPVETMVAYTDSIRAKIVADAQAQAQTTSA
jgi:hypothetical protein